MDEHVRDEIRKRAVEVLAASDDAAFDAAVQQLVDYAKPRLEETGEPMPVPAPERDLWWPRQLNPEAPEVAQPQPSTGGSPP